MKFVTVICLIFSILSFQFKAVTALSMKLVSNIHAHEVGNLSKVVILFSGFVTHDHEHKDKENPLHHHKKHIHITSIDMSNLMFLSEGSSYLSLSFAENILCTFENQIYCSPDIAGIFRPPIS